MTKPELRTVRVSRKGADRFLCGHPWIYSSDVLERQDSEPGAVVRVAGLSGRDLGVAHYSSTSQITLRMLSGRVEPVDRAFYERRLRAAIDHRRRVVQNSDAYRLVHAEGDLLPGLIVDRYGDYLVVQTLTQGMDRAKELIFDILTELLSPRGIVARNDVPVRTHEALPLEAAVVRGDVPATVPITLNHFFLEANLTGGQKTGIFLDQRENYLAAARYARGRALDCFTSTGGFALHLAQRCETVEGIDSSADALATARANAEKNHQANLTWREANVFDVLTAYDSAQRRFSTVVLDPPAFAKSKANLDAAVRGYKEINLRALRLLEPGGILVTCSCSHHFHEALLMETVASAALDAARTVRVLDRRMQSQDHPVLLTVPETLYLKCLILEVL
ncbi:MAG: class I SAM-dependent rRNA methyltransferase [Bryobacteraceae bacterium]|nr:class I SAM-dependent rRNA methyltransferase [Bryobacteraceae bacterium]